MTHASVFCLHCNRFSTATNFMTPEQRTQELSELMSQIPGKRYKRVKRIADILVCKPNTVRIWLLKDTHRPIPESKLTILRRALTETAATD